MGIFATEYSRALANEMATTKASFGRSMRTGDLNNFEDGDEVMIPQLEMGTMKDPKTRKDIPCVVYADTKAPAIITEPMLRQGAPQMREGQPVMLEYILAQVTNRNGAAVDLTGRFFPSILWKRRTPMEDRPADGIKVGVPITTSGTVVDEAVKYASLDDAIIAISGKPFIYKKIAFKGVPFGGTMDSEPDNEFVAELNFK